MDKLDKIFELQDALNKRIGVNTDDMTEEEKAEWVLNYTGDATRDRRAHRLGSLEVVGEISRVRRAECEGRGVDLFHFLISIAQVLG